MEPTWYVYTNAHSDIAYRLAFKEGVVVLAAPNRNLAITSPTEVVCPDELAARLVERLLRGGGHSAHVVRVGAARDG